jgi:regulator of replication initiation timing
MYGLTDEVHALREKAKELSAEAAALKAELDGVREGLNFTVPDGSVAGAAREAGDALQRIGRAVGGDWDHFHELPPAVERVVERVGALTAECDALRGQRDLLAADVETLKRALSLQGDAVAEDRDALLAALRNARRAAVELAEMRPADERMGWLVLLGDVDRALSGGGRG